MAEKPEDFNMPLNVVSNIIKDSLPSGVTVSADVRSAASRSASIFILYVTTCANTIATANKRKTLSAQDIIDAISQMGFEEFDEELSHLHKQLVIDKNQKEKQRLKDKSIDSTAPEVDNEDIDDNNDADDDEEEDDEEEDVDTIDISD